MLSPLSSTTSKATESMHLVFAAFLRIGGNPGLFVTPAERLGSRSLYSLAFGKIGAAFWRIGPALVSKARALWLANVNSQAM